MKNWLARFRPFLEALIASGLSPKTIQKHVDNIWALGGEIIRSLNENPSLRKKSIEQILEVRGFQGRFDDLFYSTKPVCLFFSETSCAARDDGFVPLPSTTFIHGSGVAGLVARLSGFSFDA